MSEAILKLALEYLNKEKGKLRKVKHIPNYSLTIQEYLAPNVTNIKLAKFIYHVRNRILDVKANYKNKYDDLLCPVCSLPNSVDSQEHLLHCPKLVDTMLVQGVPRYEDIFSSDVEKQVTIATAMQKLWTMRKSILK